MTKHARAVEPGSRYVNFQPAFWASHDALKGMLFYHERATNVPSCYNFSDVAAPSIESLCKKPDI